MQKEIELLELKIKKMEALKKIYALKEQNFKNSFKVSKLDVLIKRDNIKLQILKTDKLLKTDEIVLLNMNDSLEGQYVIYSMDNYSVMGFISYTPEDYNTDYGSIGYLISEPFTGNNYAYKSLLLLTKYLSLNGVEKVSISALNNNIPSLRIMDKFKEHASYEEIPVENKLIKKYNYDIKNM